MISDTTKLEILLQITLICSVFTLFYFSYSRSQATKLLNKQFVRLTDALFGDDFTYLSSDAKQIIKNQINTIPNAKDSPEYNKKLRKQTVRAVVFTLILIVIAIILSYRLSLKKDSIFLLLSFSFISLMIVSIFQYIILNYFVSNYVIVRPNKLKAALLTNVRTYIYGKM